MTGLSAPLRPGPLDIHAHIAPEALIRRFRSAERAGFGVAAGPDGRQRLVLGGAVLNPPPPPGMLSMELRLRTMDEQGVAVQLLSPWIALARYDLAEADGIWLAEALNAGIAATVAAMPDRFLGLGSAPLQAPERAAAMLRSAVLDLGLSGVEIATSAGPDRPLDHPALEPFWACAEELGAFVLIHPAQGAPSRPFDRYYLNNLIQNPLETTLAAAALIFGGVLERHPRLALCLVHGGGFLPYNLGRLVRGRQVRTETAVAMAGPVEESFARLHFDTVTHAPSALRFLVGEAGGDHVLLGSDYPFDMGDPDPVGTVRRARLAPEIEDLVTRANAERILQRPR